MFARVLSSAVIGLEGKIVEVEVNIAPGLPNFFVVGLPDTAVQEAKERVRAAIRNSGGNFPMCRITASLAPADLKKAGPAYDLPIAIGVMFSTGELIGDISDTIFLGELSLDGTLRHTNGILPMVGIARERGFKKVAVPTADAREAALVDGMTVMPFNSLTEIIACLRGERPFPQFVPDGHEEAAPLLFAATDLAEIKGQEHVKRAVEVAAAGMHNILMSGPPGAGKTLLARTLPSILPEMSNEEALEVTKIYSVSGMLPPSTPLIRQRPFRAPHYTISSAGLVGGGHVPRPGEISLAHRGVLFLDELPEFGQSMLEVLRQPLEDKTVTISRVTGSITYPAAFQFVGAMNPCPCGYFGDPFKPCTCSPGAVSRYQKRLSGPLLDRIDIFVDVPHIDYEKLADSRLGEKSERVRERVRQARLIQRERFEGLKVITNAEMTAAEVRKFCITEDTAQSLLRAAMKQLYLSARAFHRILKISRTIADLDGSEIIRAQHVAEALQYRPRSVV